MPITLGSYRTEKQLAEAAGPQYQYLRIAATDRLWAQPECIDEFIAYAKQLDMDKTWLHFHCLAGYGRTATFMVIYDIMKNSQVDLKDIVYRHAMMGGENLLQSNKGAMTRILYKYLMENCSSDYEVSWSQWQNVFMENLPVLYLRAGESVRIPGGEAACSNQNNLKVLSIKDGIMTANSAGEGVVYTHTDDGTDLYCRVEVSEDIPEIILPGKLTALRSGAFSGAAGATAVNLGENVLNVAAGAFEGTDSLRVTVKSDVTEFDDDSFGEEDKPVFLCNEESEAARFAAENEYPYFYLAN